MEPVSFTIANEVSMIPVIQSAAAAYCRVAGADEEIARQTELAVEEIVTNILQYEYLPGQEETITMTLSLKDGALQFLIRFRGIPFDVACLKQWEKKTGIDRIVESNGRGLGLRLLGRFGYEVTYRNLGWPGQEICVRRSIPAAESKPLPARKTQAASESCKTILRRMRPGDAAAISRLAYFAYRYTYIREELYEPEQVRLRNADGRMKSYVIVNNKNDEVIGHMAFFSDDLFAAVPELAAGFVHPRFRGSGGFNELTELMVRDAQAEGWQGVCGMAVTSHFYSQLAALRTGMRESALFVSHLNPLAIPNIKDQAVSRESLLYLVRIFDRNHRQPYYAPSRHREMIAQIVRNVSATANFADVSREAPLPDRGETETRTDTQQSGYLVIRRWGRDTLHTVSEILRNWCLDRLETIYLYLPLTQPATAVYSSDLEEMSFFFAGIMSGHSGADWLVMQYLNNRRNDYGLIKAATPFGRILIDYVRNCDPTAGGNPGNVQPAAL